MGVFTKKARAVEAVQVVNLNNMIVFTEAPDWLRKSVDEGRVVFDSGLVGYRVGSAGDEDMAYPTDWIVSDLGDLSVFSREDFETFFEKRIELSG